MTGPDQERPGPGPEERLPAPRPPSEPVPDAADRFTSPRSTRAVGGLTSERAAKIVRQSGDARWVAFLGLSIVALFVILYYFYETGLPLGLSTPRLDQQAEAQQVTAVERGYNLFEANCAKCHGPNGEGTNGGYIGPPLNDQMKLFDHLNPTYIKNVLTVGGRYVCGDANSLMPIWSDVNGGPLNYIQIEDIIAFIRAPSTQQYVIRDPSLNEPVVGPDGKVETFTGWVDPSFKPPADATPVPDCWSGGNVQPSSGPSESLAPGATVLSLTAQNIAYSTHSLEAPAGQSFGIDFTQKDSGVGGHNVQIRNADGTVVVDTPVLTNPGETTYVIPALPPGTYTFICKIHPIPAMTGTLTVK
jgi:mono/diheme cytochrome c family protein/plastocyanin